MESIGVGLDLALRKIISLVTPDFYSFFLKCIIIAHEIKDNSLRFSKSDFIIYHLF